MKDLNFNAATPAVGIAGFLERTTSLVTQRGYGNDVVSVANNMIALESISQNSTDASELQHAATTIMANLSGFAAEAFGASMDVSGKNALGVTAQQLKAATLAMMMGGNLRASIDAPIAHHVVATEGMFMSEAPDAGVFSRRASTESYDEQSTATSVAFSVSYNLACARQDEFGETLYPTTVIPPDQAGLMMSVDLALLMKDAKRSISGAVTDFKRYNIIRAQTYPDLLQGDATNLIPVYREDSKAFFIDIAKLPTNDVVMSDGTTITTSALATTKLVDLLAISQTDALISAGLANLTDSIDPGVQLDTIYVQIGAGSSAEIIKFPVKGLPYATFNAAVQGNYRDLTLSFDNSSLLVNSTTKKADGTASTLLAPVASGHYEVRLAVSASGRLNTQFGQTQVYGAVNGVSALYANGAPISTASGAGKTIADIFAGATLVGYSVSAKRSNLNRRQRGQVLDTTTLRQFYSLNLLAPVTVVRPHSAGEVNDARDISALIFTVQTRASIAAVANLLETAALLKSMKGDTHLAGETVETFGLARLLLDPYYNHAVYDAPAVVDSIKSHERAADIQASLVNLIRDEVYRMYQISAYQPAAASQNGGIAQAPTVIIATDQVIARYLTVTGDLRTLGDMFPVKIVSTTNIKMRGKIFITFGNMETAAAGIPNVLHWGTMQYRPEMTIILPISREGQTSKEITVSPAFRHHVNLPLLIEIDVTNIEDVVNSKVPLNFLDVTPAPVTP